MTTIRRDIAEWLSRSATLELDDADQLVEGVFAIIKGYLARGETVKISGFGKFVVRRKRARNGRNPQTGQMLVISERRVVGFKISGVLKERIQGTRSSRTKARAQ